MKHPDPVDMAEGRDRSLLGKAVRVLVILLAMLGGGVAGFAATLAIVVLRARTGHYIFALEDLVALRLDTLPIALFMVVGFVLGVRNPRGLDRAIGWGLLAMLIGIVGGAALGHVVWSAPEGTWSGAIIGGAIGLLAGGMASFRRRRRPDPRLYAGALGAGALLVLFSVGTMGATHFIEVKPLELDSTAVAPLPDPADVDAVVFLVGDAGGTEAGHSPLLRALQDDVESWSESLARDSAVSVVFLGDNVYPVGVRDRNDPNFPTDSMRLWNQIDLVGGDHARAHSTLGVFVPGNHDWGNTTGDGGHQRILNQVEQIDSARARGHAVTFLPTAGSPGPDVRDLRRNVRVLFLDTHWFLQARPGPATEEFFLRLRAAIEDAGDREVIVVSHHPYASAGPHGAILPGNHVGGVQYLLKKAGALVQDLNSPVYEEFLARIRGIFEETGRPPLVYAGGHDHSLQVMTGAADYDPRYTLVSGAGSKVSSIEMAPGLLWGGQRPGWMMMVFRKDDGVDLFVVAGDRSRLLCSGDGDALADCMNLGTSAFDVVYSTALLGPSRRPIRPTEGMPREDSTGTPWWTEEAEVSTRTLPDPEDEVVQPAPVAVPARALNFGADSVTTTPGRTYGAGPFRRFLFGDLNRELWGLPVRMPVLDLDSVAGGLHPTELIGGKQTIGLRFRGRNGLNYEFRSIVKDAGRALPEFLRGGIIRDMLDDQMAAQFPLGVTVASRLLEAVGIDAPDPVPVVMPNDPRLGAYRALFAGRVGLFALQANERDDGRPGFGGYESILDDDDFAEVLAREPVEIEERYFLRIRFMDMLIGDWDRHAGQWNWAVVQDSTGRRFHPIPEDRDWAFCRIDGIMPKVTRLFMARYVGFSDRFPPVHDITQAGADLDQRFLSRLSREDFVAVARDLQGMLTDSVIDAAIGVLPQNYQARQRGRLTSGLRARRESLDRLALDYYAFVARDIHVFGTPGMADTVTFERVSQGVRVTLASGGVRRFERILDGDTERVTLHLEEGEDTVIGGDDLPFDLTFAEHADDDD